MYAESASGPLGIIQVLKEPSHRTAETKMGG